MKQFMYCQDCEGGMEVHLFNSVAELKFLRGWVAQDCLGSDTALENWMKTAKVGEYSTHRLGVCIRLKGSA